MFLSSWFPWRLAQQHKGRSRPSHVPALRRRRIRLACEQLEDRTVPSTVTTLLDVVDPNDGVLSLREAVQAANATAGADIIDFAPGLAGNINLAGALPDLSTNIDIQGPGADLLTVRRNTGGSYRIFTVVSGATVALRDLSISDGFAQHGGGIFNAGTLTVENSSVSGNVSGNEEPWSGSDGGGIYNTGTLTVTASTLSANNCGTGGGAIYNSAGTVTVTDCTISGNSAAIIGGGGIYNAATLTVTNSTLSGNEVWWYGSGGGIYNAGTATVASSTITRNFAADGGVQPGGGGIYNAATLHSRNTIIAGNEVESTPGAPDLYGSLTSSGYNLIGNTSGGSGFASTDLLNVDPLLGPLQDNGGPTWTRALLPDSPAIDAGDNTDAPPFDQRGLARIFDGNGDGTATIDIGAYEVQTVLPGNTPPVAVNDSYSTNDTSLTVTAPGVLGNDTDVDGNSLTAVLVSGPAHGTLTLYSNGAFTYTPAANYNGPDSFTYKANDGAANSNLATVSITAVNDPPVAQAQSISTPEDTAYSGQVVATDVDSTSLSYIIVAGPTHGTLSFNSITGAFIYTPFANYNGPDSFNFKASDGQAASNLATVSITVTAVNDAPVNNVPTGTQTTAKNTDLIFHAISIADVDAGSAQVTLGVTSGTLTLSGTSNLSFTVGDGTADASMTFTGTIEAINTALNGLHFTPRKNFTRPVTLTITTNDLGNSGSGGALSDTDTVAIAVGMPTSQGGAGSPLVASVGAPGSIIPSEGQSLADIRPGFLRRPSRTASIDALFAAFQPDGPASPWW